MDQEKIPYHDWAGRGLLTIVDAEYIDDTAIYQWFLDRENEGYDIRCIGYDPANAVRLTKQLQGHGWDTDIVRQGAITLSDPLKEIRVLMLQGALVMNNDPMMRWYIHNVRLRNSQSDAEMGNWVPTKRSRFRKIDGFAAMLDAWVVWRRKAYPEDVVTEPSVTVIKLNRNRGGAGP